MGFTQLRTPTDHNGRYSVMDTNWPQWTLLSYGHQLTTMDATQLWTPTDNNGRQKDIAWPQWTLLSNGHQLTTMDAKRISPDHNGRYSVMDTNWPLWMPQGYRLTTMDATQLWTPIDHNGHYSVTDTNWPRWTLLTSDRDTRTGQHNPLDASSFDGCTEDGQRPFHGGPDHVVLILDVVSREWTGHVLDVRAAFYSPGEVKSEAVFKKKSHLGFYDTL